MAYKVIYNPLTDYTLEAMYASARFYSKASSLCLLTVGWYGVTCRPNLCVDALVMESK